MTEIGLGAAMNDSFIEDLKEEIDFMMTDLFHRDMGFGVLKYVMFHKQYLEIEIEKREMQLKIEKIKIEIDKLDELRKKTKVNQVSVEEKKKMRLHIDNIDHRKLLSETMPLAEEKMKEIGFEDYPHPDLNTMLKSRIEKLNLLKPEIYNIINKDHRESLSETMPLVEEKMKEIGFEDYPHPDLNTALKSNIEKLNLLKLEIYKMEGWIYDMKMTKMKLKDITIPDVECARQVFHFHDEESSDNELKTYVYNDKKISSIWTKSCSIEFARQEQVSEGMEQVKANGLDFATDAGKRTISQYWHLPLKEPKQLLGGVYWKKMELPEKGGLCGWDEVEKWPVTLQIYSLKLMPCCCSDGDQEEDCSVVVSGEISLLIPNGDRPSIIHVRRQTITKKDPYVLLDDPTYIPFLFFFNPPPMIHAKLVFRGSDEPDKLTRSMEVVDEVYMSGKEFSEGTSALSEDVNLGTGKHYRLKLTHGIVVNTVVANISVRLLDPSLLDSSDIKCKITAATKYNIRRLALVANYKKVPVTSVNGCLQLLRSRICVDFFGELVLCIKFFHRRACFHFRPRDCSRHDHCQHKEELEGIIVQVKWSTR